MSGENDAGATDPNPEDAPAGMSLEELQHWTWVIGRAQQMMMSYAAEMLTSESGRKQAMGFIKKMGSMGGQIAAPLKLAAEADPVKILKAQTEMIAAGVDIWKSVLAGGLEMLSGHYPSKSDRRFNHESWQSHPIFAIIRQSYLYIADQWMNWADHVDGLDPAEKQNLRFKTQAIVDALAPTNFALTNPEVIERTLETRGDNLLKGLEHMLADLKKGQLTQTATEAFELGVDLAATRGKVIKRTQLYELIQYRPTTENVLAIPLVIFPAWINRFYILDLGKKKSFVQWALDQGLTVFMVSWKSADESMRDVIWDDYIAAQIDAVDTVRELLGVEQAHTIGYCVAGTTLAATLAVTAAKGEAARFASATFFTAQVDFENAGDLKAFLSPEGEMLYKQLGSDGYIDGRYLAATFNMLRGRDLIWSYVVQNYLLGQDYTPFDLLYWNGDTTNLPAKWHRQYIDDLYVHNRMIQPGALSALGSPIDLGRNITPLYIQAGREDHIAPLTSVWKAMHLLGGKKRFLLAGSGHIAGVVNPPSSGKYQYWINDAVGIETIDDFIAGATEHPGSWWPDWIEWIRALDEKEVPAKGARIPGKGKLKALEDAPGSYVKTR